QLNGHLDTRVGQYGAQIRRHELAGKSDRPWFGPIAHDHTAKKQRTAGPGGQALAVFQQQPGDAAAHGAAADQGNAKGFHVLRSFRPCPSPSYATNCSRNRLLSRRARLRSASEPSNARSSTSMQTGPW